MRLIYGAGGHGRVVADVLEAAGQPADGFVDARPLGVVDSLEVFEDYPNGAEVIPGIGDNAARQRLMLEVLERDGHLGCAIHPTAWISPRAEISPGAVVFAGAVVNCGARIGMGAIVNSNAVVEHDCIVGAWAHLSPNSTLGGAAVIGEGAWLGLGGVVLPGIQVGNGAIVGAGAVAVRDIPATRVAIGVPARVITP